jgi:hypothetical protein
MPRIKHTQPSKSHVGAAQRLRFTRVVLAAAHLDNNPANNRLANLKSLCQRCHMLHDRPFHLAQRWLTYRRRLAVGDLFLGRYGMHTSLPAIFATAHRAWLPRAADLRPRVLSQRYQNMLFDLREARLSADQTVHQDPNPA